MTQEEKQLLFQDLCARLPYGVKGIRDYADEVVTLHFIIPNCKRPNDKTGFIELEFTNLDCCPINEFKPYLRPMSSMTKEEKKIMRSCGFELILYDTGIIGFANIESCIDEVAFGFMEEFLNSNYFDYRGLIEKGLALEAKEGMYKTE